jgi:glycosyltransferase involved in cell wall biosynthesis
MKIEKRIELPVSILMPVCNEADVIETVIEEWVRDVFQYLPKESEFIFDEAGSDDGTKEILQRICGKYDFIRVIYNDHKDGFAAASRRLYSSANCPLVFFTDADGQYVAEEFWKLAPFIGEFSMVHGAKIGRQDYFYRKLASLIFNRVARFIFDIHYSDLNSAFRIIKKGLIKELLPRLNCMPTLINAELIIRTEMENYAIKQVHIVHRKRQHGKSRGLPAVSFLKESMAAYGGLLKLKSEYVK